MYRKGPEWVSKKIILSCEDKSARGYAGRLWRQPEASGHHAPPSCEFQLQGAKARMALGALLALAAPKRNVQQKGKCGVTNSTVLDACSAAGCQQQDQHGAQNLLAHPQTRVSSTEPSLPSSPGSHAATSWANVDSVMGKLPPKYVCQTWRNKN